MVGAPALRLYVPAPGTHIALHRSIMIAHCQAERNTPINPVAGHTADVDVVRWHPNCQYIATGSTDRSVILWDVRSGDRARRFVSHRAEVSRDLGLDTFELELGL